MVSNVLHVPIVHQDIGVIMRKRGIISGSYFTNIMDSLSNVMILHYCDSESRFIQRAIVYGDDNLICTNFGFYDMLKLERELAMLRMKITYDKKDLSKSFETEFAGSK